MGKKSTFKKLRRIASTMPEIQVGQVVGHRLTGADLIEQGVKEVEGKPVNEKEMYRKKTVETKQLNHNRNMKRAYYQNGKKGVIAYARAVDQHVALQKAMEEAK